MPQPQVQGWELVNEVLYPARQYAVTGHDEGQVWEWHCHLYPQVTGALAEFSWNLVAGRGGEEEDLGYLGV